MIQTKKISTETYLEDNPVFQEYEVPQDVQVIGDLCDIDLNDNELWLMQCPKNMDIKQLKSQTIKMPGRTNLENLETVCTDLPDNVRKEAFALYHNGKYSMRLLPIKGTIIVRNRLKADKAVTEKEIETSFTITKRASMPKNLRVRHPLFGVQYEETSLNDNIKRRLKEADENSLKMLKETVSKTISPKISNRKRKQESNESPLPIKIKVEKTDGSDVEFVSETLNKQSCIKEKQKTRKRKNKNCYSNGELNSLEWLSNI